MHSSLLLVGKVNEFSLIYKKGKTHFCILSMCPLYYREDKRMNLYKK